MTASILEAINSKSINQVKATVNVILYGDLVAILFVHLDG
jgi:hypothetical protein